MRRGGVSGENPPQDYMKTMCLLIHPYVVTRKLATGSRVATSLFFCFTMTYPPEREKRLPMHETCEKSEYQDNAEMVQYCRTNRGTT